MFPFRSLFNRRQPRPIVNRQSHKPRPQTRLQVEALEERVVMNNRFVVPIGVPADNAATFNSLKGALTTSGLGTGDVVQIEPGSTPGNVTNVDLPTFANLTIQGDPAAALTTIPMFTVSDAAVFPITNTGFTLKNVNLGLIDAGSLRFYTSTTISGCSIVDINSSAGIGVFFTPVSNSTNTITNTTFANLGGAAGSNLVEVTPNSTGTGNSNTFLNNTFVASGPTASGRLLYYFNPGTVTVTGSVDTVSNNSFLGNAGSGLGSLFATNATMSGLTVQGNTFSDPDAAVVAITLSNFGNDAQQNTTVTGNTIRLSGTNSVGIEVDAGNSGSSIVANTYLNQIAAPNGVGLDVVGGSAATAVALVRSQANDFHGCKIGVKVNVTGNSNGNLSVDLGGSTGLFGGGLGDNNFRGLGAASATQGPIVVAGSNPGGALTIFAKNNIFGGNTPFSFKDAGLTNVTVNVSNALTGNAAYVETLYVDYLHRTGDTAPGGDAVVWVNAITNNQLTLAQVANGIIHSAEALGIVVDGLYLKFLGRTADAGGRTQFVNFLVGGGTLEQATAILISSPEYNARAGSDTGFVQNLYANLLGRIPNNAETASWLSVVASQGRTAVAAALLNSSEYRSLAVQQMYGFVSQPAISEASLFYPALHRTAAPAASEIASWANSGLDLLAIETALVGGSEFFTNG